MKERTEEMETMAVLRRLKRQGVREVEWVQTAGGQLQVRARVQTGRAHQLYTSGPHAAQLDALVELSEAVAEKREPRRSRPKPTARRLHRPEAGQATGPIDDVPLAEQPERMADLPPFRHARKQAERAERVKARHSPDRPEALPPAPQERPGRGGGR